MNATEQKLAELRKTLKGKVREDGIFLVASFRYEDSARWVAETAKELGAREPKVYKLGKTTYRDHTTSRTWKVRFTIGISEDAYIAGRVNMQFYREWEADKAKRAADKAS